MEDKIENKENEEGKKGKVAFFQEGGWYSGISKNDKNVKTVNRLAIVAGAALIILFVLLTIFAPPSKLDTPVVLFVSSDGIIFWTAVDNASGYIIKASAGTTNIEKDVSSDAVSFYSDAVSFDLTTLNLISGITYQISIKAVGDGYSDSDYSAIVNYVV